MIMSSTPSSLRGPGTPRGPLEPGRPILPLRPTGPVRPLAPVGPCAPRFPGGPFGPARPFNPLLPLCPCGPRDDLATNASTVHAVKKGTRRCILCYKARANERRRQQRTFAASEKRGMPLADGKRLVTGRPRPSGAEGCGFEPCRAHQLYPRGFAPRIPRQRRSGARFAVRSAGSLAALVREPYRERFRILAGAPFSAKLRVPGQLHAVSSRSCR